MNTSSKKRLLRLAATIVLTVGLYPVAAGFAQEMMGGQSAGMGNHAHMMAAQQWHAGAPGMGPGTMPGHNGPVGGPQGFAGAPGMGPGTMSGPQGPAGGPGMGPGTMSGPNGPAGGPGMRPGTMSGPNGPAGGPGMGPGKMAGQQGGMRMMGGHPGGMGMMNRMGGPHGTPGGPSMGPGMMDGRPGGMGMMNRTGCPHGTSGGPGMGSGMPNNMGCNHGAAGGYGLGSGMMGGLFDGMKSHLEITPAQESVWVAFVKAANDDVTAHLEMFTKMRDAGIGSIERLEKHVAMMETLLPRKKALLEAMRTMYNQLSETQKQRFTLGPRPGFGMGRMMEEIPDQPNAQP